MGLNSSIIFHNKATTMTQIQHKNDTNKQKLNTEHKRQHI